MSVNDGFNTQTNTTGRNEGFMDSNEGPNSYGQGMGSGVSVASLSDYDIPDVGHHRRTTPPTLVSVATVTTRWTPPTLLVVGPTPQVPTP